MRIGSLFSGAGGLDMAVEAVFGGEVVWHSEVDKAAATVLAYRWPGVPNLGDVTAVDWSWHQPVDVLCGGFPCQDVSAAGKRAGIKDGTRSGLWAVFADAIDALRPPIVIIENVRGLLSAQAHRNLEPDDPTMGDRPDRPVLRAAGAVLGDLADLGYDAVWATVAAADVGAPHRRERVFIVATDTAVGGWEARQPQSEGQRRKPVIGTGSHRAGHLTDVERLLPTRGTDTISPASTKCTDCPNRGDNPQRLGFVVSPSGTTESLLPTPTAQAARHAGESRFGGGNGDASNLWQIAHLLPTPQARDHKGTDSAGDNNRRSPGMDAVTHRFPGLLPTPNASDATGGGAHPDKRVGHSRQLIDYALLDGAEAWGKYAPAIHRWEQLTRPAPAPTEPNKNGNPRLAAAFSEWLMGWPHGWVTDPDIGISRNDQLRIIGNGVCPQQAIAALTWLLQIAETAA